MNDQQKKYDPLEETLREFATGAYKAIGQAVQREAELVGIKPEDIQSGKYQITTEEKKGEQGGYKQILYSAVDKKKNRIKLLAVEFMPTGFTIYAKKTIEVLKHRIIKPDMTIH